MGVVVEGIRNGLNASVQEVRYPFTFREVLASLETDTRLSSPLCLISTTPISPMPKKPRRSSTLISRRLKRS
jgi:hypothetical protein